MKKKIEQIVGELKDRIAGKYSIKEMRVFGSSARGDRKPESDIDVLVHLSHVNRQIEEDLFDMAYDLELKHDCLIDVIVVDDRDFLAVADIVCNVFKQDVAALGRVVQLAAAVPFDKTRHNVLLVPSATTCRDAPCRF